MRHADEEIERRLQVLIKRGELAEEEGLRLRDKLLGLGRQLSDRTWLAEQEVERVLADRGVPDRAELDQIRQQLEALAAKLDRLSPEEGETEADEG